METVSSSVDLSDLLIPRRDGEERRGMRVRENRWRNCNFVCVVIKQNASSGIGIIIIIVPGGGYALLLVLFVSRIFLLSFERYLDKKSNAWEEYERPF